MLKIRKAIKDDYDQVWSIIREVISQGDTYVFDPSSSKDKMLAFWFGEGKHTYVATLDGKIVGTFVIRDNQPDLGSHIANAAYMVLGSVSRQGIGKAMGEYSLQEAKRIGYKAMQFNIVIKDNDRAVRLWQRLGFVILGEIPEAFNHKEKGMINAYIMHRKL